MGTVTLTIEDDVEARLRQFTGSSKKRKGALGSAVSEAVRSWLDAKQQQDIAKRELEILSKGYKMGRFSCKNRDEWHER